MQSCLAFDNADSKYSFEESPLCSMDFTLCLIPPATSVPILFTIPAKRILGLSANMSLHIFCNLFLRLDITQPHDDVVFLYY